MWPERLLQVSQAIMDSVDDSRLGSFFNLARLSEPRNLVIDEYNAELLERGWTGGIKDIGERQMLEIRQPDLGCLDSMLKATFPGADVTTKKVREGLGLAYFTSLHIIKEMERSGELELVEFEVGPLWRWKEA